MVNLQNRDKTFADFAALPFNKKQTLIPLTIRYLNQHIKNPFHLQRKEIPTFSKIRSSPELSDEFSASTQELSSQTPMKMAWYRFLIYFSLFAGAFINFLTSLSLLMGRYYTNKKTTEFLYNMYDDLRSLDILMALLLIMISAWGIFTRFRLARYRKNGPLYLNIHYGSSIAWCLIFIYSLSSITNVSPTELASAYIPSIIAGIILIVTNTLYFQKRKHLFIR